MPLTNLHDMLAHAGDSGYALGSFELRSLEFLDGVLSAAELAQSPVILGINPAVPDFLPLLVAAHASAGRARVPVALHLEAASSLEEAVAAIRHGCNGFTLNTLHLPTPEHTELTTAAAALSRDTGVPAAGTWHATVDDHNLLADNVMAAEAFARKTGVAFLHLKRPHAHGPRANDRDFIALVQQCGVMGLTLAVDEECAEAPALAELIRGGVAKIHCNAALTNAALQRYSDVSRSARYDYDMFSQRLRQAIADVAAPRLAAWGSQGKAGEALQACRLHREVEHLIIYNVEAAAGEARAQEMMAAGRQVLGAIPGVRRVFTGQSVDPDARYRYCWLVRFTDQAVIDSYRDHPDHQHFADTLFRPVAGDRISIDFENTE